MPRARCDVAIAVVNHNTCTHLRACLTSARAGEIVVIDNASSDGSAEMVRKEFPGVVLRVNHANRGYGAAANQALAACASPYVVLVNADTVLAPETPTALADYLEAHPQVAVAGPRLVNLDGTLQPSCRAFPSATMVLVEFTPLARIVRALRHVPGLGYWYPPAWPHHRARAVDWVKGAALAIRRQAFAEVGGFDDSFFMYWEETDLSYRLAAAGWQTHFAPMATVVHAGEASTSQQRAAMSLQLFHGLRRFSARHHSPRQRRAVAAALHIVLQLRVAQDTVRLRLSRDPARRQWLQDSIAIWSRALHGS